MYDYHLVYCNSYMVTYFKVIYKRQAIKDTKAFFFTVLREGNNNFGI